MTTDEAIGDRWWTLMTQLMTTDETIYDNRRQLMTQLMKTDDTIDNNWWHNWWQLMTTGDNWWNVWWQLMTTDETSWKLLNLRDPDGKRDDSLNAIWWYPDAHKFWKLMTPYAHLLKPGKHLMPTWWTRTTIDEPWWKLIKPVGSWCLTWYKTSDDNWWQLMKPDEHTWWNLMTPDENLMKPGEHK